VRTGCDRCVNAQGADSPVYAFSRDWALTEEDEAADLQLEPGQSPPALPLPLGIASRQLSQSGPQLGVMLPVWRLRWGGVRHRKSIAPRSRVHLIASYARRAAEVRCEAMKLGWGKLGTRATSGVYP
jgi:hypothetical protein